VLEEAELGESASGSSAPNDNAARSKSSVDARLFTHKPLAFIG
jgi:hypothetical protein